jgi:peroxiredoxin Q/BCP
VILGVSFDTVQENKHFAEKFNFPYPLLSDPTRAMGVQYGAADAAESKNAKRVAYVIGPDGKVRNVFPKANPGTFAADVLALL